jgi:hypothetical protein
VRDGVGINGLPILTLEPFLDRYYYDNVIGGPGAFVIPAENYDTFADAILKKLITEIADDAGPSRRSIASDNDSTRGVTNSANFAAKISPIPR